MAGSLMAFKSAPCFICHNIFDFNTERGEPLHPVCRDCSNKIRPQLAKKQNLIDQPFNERKQLDKTSTENARND
jgi:hypothetical protein